METIVRYVLTAIGFVIALAFVVGVFSDLPLALTIVLEVVNILGRGLGALARWSTAFGGGVA